ncbi:flagellar hook-associated protein FlgK [Paracoccus jiaweipingae]|uniref:flagellar hook-associated protein FlgK n=1 Tax=unclassified Paracoccus (in: a-proteobacteria) TaxID=2688777 RepID=UPI00379C4E1F
MSLASAISNAMSGITTASRLTEVAASNIANAANPAYARREAALSSRIFSGTGGGVQIDGIDRVISLQAVADRRSASAQLGADQLRSGFLGKMEEAIGLPGDPGALTTALAQLKASIVTATANPTSKVTLDRIVDSAKTLSGKINDLANTVQDERSAVDADIGRQIDLLNDRLHKIAEINKKIVGQKAQNGDATGLIEQRQIMIDEISQIIPLKEVSRDNGRISLFSQSGAALLDGTVPVTFGFKPAGQMNAHMVKGTPLVSDLLIDGEPADEGQYALLQGGKLVASFELRDTIAPHVQNQLDGLAAELYSVFADPQIDPTNASGGHGLFTDTGGDFDPANLTGLSARISVAQQVDHHDTGESYRIRDGIYATAQGAPGNTQILEKLSDAFDTFHAPATPVMGSGSSNLTTYFATFVSEIGQKSFAAEKATTQTVAYYGEMDNKVRAFGTDSDVEVQKILDLQTAYAANAKVIQAASDMMNIILGLRS